MALYGSVEAQGLIVPRRGTTKNWRLPVFSFAAMHLSWSAAEVDEKLHAIMHGIHAQCVKYGTEPDGYINYVKGANIAGFMKVAHAMMGQGVI